MASGIIWTPDERVRQPRSVLKLANKYRNARFSAVASLFNLPVQKPTTINTVNPSNGYVVGPKGQAYSVADGFPIGFLNYSAVDTGIAIGASESWTLIVHCDVTGFSGANPGIFRTSSGGDTFFIFNGTTLLPWVRVDGTNVLNPGSGDAIATGTSTVFVCSMASGSRVDVAWDGAVRHSATHTVAQTAGQFNYIGRQGSEYFQGRYYSLTWLPWAVTPQEAAALSTPEGYYGNVFEAENDPVFYSLAAGGSNNTATLSSTLDVATLTGVGVVTRSGTLAVTLDAATLAGIGTAAVTNKTGTLAVTLDAATLAGVGAVTRSGTLAVTLDAATLAGVGSVAVGSNRDGTLASTLADATLAGIGGVTRSGTLSVTLDAATLAGIGTAGQPRTGTLSVTLDNATLRGIGAIPAAPSTGGGKTTGSNLSRKQKKKLKAVESQEWLKAEETARQLLSDRFTKQTPQEKAQALETYIESLQPVIEALKALTSQIEEVVEEAPIIELTPHQEVIQRFDRLEKKVKSVEELIIILMADL